LGTSGILMGVNAPPLYDACLVGRWEEVLELCGVVVPSSTINNDDGVGGGVDHHEGEEEESHQDQGNMSDDSPKTGTTHCSSSNEGEDPGFPSGSRLSVNTNNGNRADNDDETSQTSTQNSQHPCLQTRYADRRRNTPLHLACRRQPPPLVVRALLNHSPCEAVSRRTADGLTPLHFAAYCGAGVEVVSMLVDRMRSDAAVGRAMRLSLRLNEEVGSEVNNSINNNNNNNNNNKEGLTNAKDNSNRSGDNNGRWRLPSEESSALPPTRLLDRRRRTPLHCALSGFRTPIRPVVVRKLLAVDPASATLGDERGRTPLSLLFDDYAEEIMETLEEDVSNGMARERIREGGELHECWRMLTVLLQAAYRGSVSEDEEGEGNNKGIATTTIKPLMQTPQQRQSMTHPISAVIPEVLTGSSNSHDGSDDDEDNDDSSAPTPTPHNTPQPQDRQQSIKEVNVVEMYDQEHFSMVHAAAGVWECPAPLAKLVLKCLCGGDDDEGRKSKGTTTTTGAREKSKESPEEWDHHDPVDLSDRDFRGAEDLVGDDGRDEVENNGDDDEDDVDPIQQPDEETMRLPLHIAVCARPQGREGYSARLKAWLLSTPETANSLSTSSSTPSSTRRSNSRSSMASLATHPDRGRSPTTNPAGQVYNPRFGRSPSRDSVVAYSQSTKLMGRGRSGHGSNGGGGGGSAPGARGFISRSGSNASISANIAREPFLQHTMVRDVLALHPHAASVVDDRTGKLPIVLAIEHGKSWETAVGPLLEAYPQPFGGGGDGGMALPDDGPEGRGHREDLQAALFVALSSPEIHVRDEAIRTAGKLAKWGGVYGMPGSLDGIVSEWLDNMANHGNIAADGAASSSPASPEGIVVGPGASPWSAVDPYQTQSSHLTAVAEVISHSRPESVSDRVARLCLDASREYLFSKDGSVREAAARVLGNTLNSVGDADDAANVMREVVLNMTNDEGSVVTVSSKSVFGANRDNEESVIAKHGRLLACNSILSTQWGSDLVVTPDICDAVMAFIHGCVKDRNNNAVVRSAAYHAVGPLLGKSSAIATHTDTLSKRTSTSTLKEMRSDILKGTRASEHVDVQVALARGLTAASRMHPGIFLCKGGMPVMDAALMLAMSSSVKRPQVQKAFQIFLWVALQMGGGGGGGNVGNGHADGAMYVGTASGGGGGSATMSSPGLERYIELAEGENGRIMMKFVTQTLAKIEDLDDQGGMCR